ncbi:6320_t:CDS:2, partial [Gigaspora margarita]
KEIKTTLIYCEAQVKGYFILLVLDSGSSKCLVLANFLKEVNVAIDSVMTNSGNYTVIVGNDWMKNKGEIRLGREPEKDVSISEEETESEIDE